MQGTPSAFSTSSSFSEKFCKILNSFIKTKDYDLNSCSKT